MLYLLWTAINGVVLIYFFAACVASAQAIRERVGLVPLLLVVVGLLNFRSGSHGAAATTRATASPLIRSGPGERAYIKAHDYYIAAIQVQVSYEQAADSCEVIQSNSTLTGFQLGNTWQPMGVGATIKANKLHYYADGIMEWHLLGVTIYREHKYLTGVLPVR
jgi:hypothetical protein